MSHLFSPGGFVMSWPKSYLISDPDVDEEGLDMPLPSYDQHTYNIPLHRWVVKVNWNFEINFKLILYFIIIIMKGDCRPWHNNQFIKSIYINKDTKYSPQHLSPLQDVQRN